MVLTEQEIVDAIDENHIKIEDVLYLYLNTHSDAFSPTRIFALIQCLQNGYLLERITHLELTRAHSREMAFYLKKYLEGNMYVDDEVAKKHASFHAKQAESIMNACRGWKLDETWSHFITKEEE